MLRLGHGNGIVNADVLCSTVSLKRGDEARWGLVMVVDGAMDTGNLSRGDI